MPPKSKPSGGDPPDKQPPERRYVPGYGYADGDKGAKKSRRRKKSGNKEEPSEAGPSQ